MSDELDQQELQAQRHPWRPLRPLGGIVLGPTGIPPGTVEAILSGRDDQGGQGSAGLGSNYGDSASAPRPARAARRATRRRGKRP
jgi:hypothetical protein